jgi:hypothetical protein
VYWRSIVREGSGEKVNSGFEITFFGWKSDTPSFKKLWSFATEKFGSIRLPKAGNLRVFSKIQEVFTSIKLIIMNRSNRSHKLCTRNQNLHMESFQQERVWQRQTILVAFMRSNEIVSQDWLPTSTQPHTS